MLSMGRGRLGAATVGILLMAGVAFGQTSSVNGRVTDSQGAVIANATVALVPPPTAPMPGMKMTVPPPRTASANANGAFTLDQVPAGTYLLQVDAPGFERSSQEITVPGNGQPFNVTLDALEIPGAEAVGVPAKGGGVDPQVLLNQVRALQERVAQLEASTVLSEPETRVKRIEIWVDRNGNEHDQQVPGATRKVTYQRERVYRRQTINEKIEEALAEAEEHNVKLGINATIATQAAAQNRGPKTDASGHTYELASADLFFTAGVAQNTVFFADLVGLSGAPPDAEIPALTLLNAYTARLVRQNDISVREAWLRTELFSQKLALVAGRLDLTNYFDHNAAANDETTQFLSDALVNNPALGLAVNGTGLAAVYDPKNGLTFKVGFQQSNTDATNLTDSIYWLGEVGYLMTPFSLPEGNYRAWYRVDNSSERQRAAFGLSLDQKLAPAFTLFGRYGSADAGGARDRYYSGGLQIQYGYIFNPGDVWGVGYAQTELAAGLHERLVEGYYNFGLTERLRLSFHLQHVLDREDENDRFGYFLPGVRLQASF
jgi:Carboxypeptidase regulatory-like domain